MFHIVVCGGIVPDPLQTLEPVKGPAGWGLKNELMLPSILDPWASHALYEAAHERKIGTVSWWWLGLAFVVFSGLMAASQRFGIQ